MLNAVRQGAPTDRPALLIVPGLFGSARNWGVISRRLSADRLVVAVDQRNHGDSPWMGSHSYPDLAADLAEVIEDIGGPVDILGHSMGGKAAMVLAVSRPELVRRLIVGDIAPVAYGHTQEHLIDAMEAIGSSFASRGEADRALAQHVDDPGTRAFLLQSLDLRAGRWKLNLPVLRRDMKLILSFPEVSGEFDGPALFLSGAESDYVKAEYRETIRGLFPKARFAKLPGAGHWIHADKPREVEETVRVFLDA